MRGWICIYIFGRLRRRLSETEADKTLRLAFTPLSILAVSGAWNGVRQSAACGMQRLPRTRLTWLASALLQAPPEVPAGITGSGDLRQAGQATERTQATILGSRLAVSLLHLGIAGMFMPRLVSALRGHRTNLQPSIVLPEHRYAYKFLRISQAKLASSLLFYLNISCHTPSLVSLYAITLRPVPLPGCSAYAPWVLLDYQSLLWDHPALLYMSDGSR